MRIVCISDTHLAHTTGTLEVPDGDVLLHAGDATRHGSLPEIERFSDWFAGFPHRHKVLVAGNHDWGFQRQPEAARAALDPSIVYLEDRLVELEGLRVWGTPWQPEFFAWAFNLPRGEALREKWRLVPAGVDVLLSHGPPYGFGDRVARGERAGCEDLLDEVRTRIRPRLHVFGHIHEGYGRYQDEDRTLVNASLVDVRYRIANRGIVVDL